MKKNIIILYGGSSTEREVSLKTGEMIFNHINRKKYHVALLDLRENINTLIRLIKNKKVDLVFIALHGKRGEDGAIQGLLDTLNIKYTGSGVSASTIGMDKELTKLLLNNHGIKTPTGITLIKKERFKKIPFSFPCIAKPANHGSSIKINIVNNKKELEKTLKKIFKIDKKAIVEEYISGTEVSVGIIEKNKKIIALPPIEILPKWENFFNYKAKYSGKSEEIVPARIGKLLTKKVKELAIKVHKLIGCEIISRVDIIIQNNKNPYILEINTIPGMTKESLLPKSAKSLNIEFSQLIDIIIKESLNK